LVWSRGLILDHPEFPLIVDPATPAPPGIIVVELDQKILLVETAFTAPPFATAFTELDPPPPAPPVKGTLVEAAKY
jgi:hypothetical protein